MADKSKKVGVEIHGGKVLHGKRVRLMNGENEYVGILLANDHQTTSNNMIFKYTDSHGVSSVRPVTTEEMKNIEDYLLDY